MAASLSNPGLREKFVPQLRAWQLVVQEGVEDAVATLERSGVKLPPPYDAGVIATWIAEFWIGMEVIDLLGYPEARRKHQGALDAMEVLLQGLDARVKNRKRKS